MNKPYAITLEAGTSRANKTGAWRTERPVYRDLLPPCNNACPAGENIQQWLYRAEEGPAGYEAGWRQIMADNPFPAIMGRVCYRPCETACNRAQLDTAVGINSGERFLGDEAIRCGWQVPVTVPPKTGQPTGKRVLVVGAGPSGLSAAYHLTRMGHAVTVRDAGAEPGGMMRYGIPKYRLPRDVLDAEISRVLEMGVTLELGSVVTDLSGAMSSGGFDAVFVACGAHIGRRTYIPAGDSARILDAVSVLRSMEGETPPMLGRRVAVYGGGNTAMDAARTARRLGASEAVDAGSLILEKMRLDETGFPQPTGEYETLEADCLVLALGQDADLTVLSGVSGVTFADGVVQVGPDLMTGHPGIFAGGDMVPSERTVTVAIGHGKKAARSIDAWLRGPDPGAGLTPARHPAAGFGLLNTWYYSDAPATVRPVLDAARRISTFDEVTGGLDESTALFEARRCMSCGNCFGCDNCYGVCPDNAIIKHEDGTYEVDLDYCKGCGLCATECPCGAIEMILEST